MEDYGNHVEILGVKFPAANIQIWDCYPELYLSDCGFPESGEMYFGLYFELMFENGAVLVVSQEATDVVNGKDVECKDKKNLNHFVIEEFSKVQTVEPSFVYHCSGEHELVTMLQDLKEGLSEPRAA